MTSKQDVFEWLKANPGVFEEHPELLDELELAHTTGTTSLIEHQVRRLREENHRLESRLKQLAGIAGENERLMQRLHQLTLEVMTTDSSAGFIRHLFERLAEDFNADHVRLHLLKRGSDLDSAEEVSIHDQPPAWFSSIIDNAKPECGRLTREKMALMFGDCDPAVGSAALIPVNGAGLLAIGSTSPERFYPGMGTLFLELLGTTIRYRLEHAEPDQRRRA